MIGFIGAGNMASAMIGGIIKKGLKKPEDIICSAKTEESRKRVNSQYGVKTAHSNKEAAEKSSILFLAVKPFLYETVMEEIKDVLSPECIVISIAPGKTLVYLQSVLGEDKKIIRTMPNTPAMVLEGMTAVCPNEKITNEELSAVMALFEGFGKACVVEEKHMDAVVSLSGSSPAYVFMFIEAMADAAVADGIPRKQAYEFAAQSVLGSAKMVLDTGMHPAVLKDMVCSPGGTTIEAVRILEAKGMRSSVIEAMKACTKKAKGV